MTSREIAQWQAYEHVDGPLGGARDDHLAALIAFYTLRAMGVKQAKPDKLIPQWDKGRKAMSWQDMKAAARAIAKNMGG